ncbi:MAG: response regulator [Verrucomicrobiota bacterium]|nr:response regulator [Verrucomicrobiota bacterium]
MLDHEDLKWIATTSTELNSMLQQISRYSDLARQHKGEYNYIEMLGERVEMASNTAQSLFDRVTSKILAGSTGKAAAAANRPASTPQFSVLPPPSAAPPSQSPGPQRPAPEPLTVSGRQAPAEEAATPPKPAAAARAPIPPEIKVLNAKGNRELILLVDDEQEIAELASEMLAEEGYEVILAKDGMEALRIYEKIAPHIGLVVLDFFLPVMDGDAVFDELRALNPDVAVVLSSGFAEQSKVGTMLAQGLRGFIPKPYTREKLLEQVRSTLDSVRLAGR